MQSTKMNLKLQHKTPYSDINDLLLFWAGGVYAGLGEKVIGVYLTGSLTYGDFVPKRSDVDLCVVVKPALSVAELESIKRLHLETEQRYPHWAKRVECSYLPIDLIHEVLPPKTPRPWWGHGVFYAEAPYGNEWIINQYFLYTSGIALMGPEYRTLVSHVDLKEVQKASARDLFQEWEPKIHNSESLDDGHLQSYVVLNLCRILYTVVQGKAGSKKAAGAWVKAACPQWKSLIEEADSWGHGAEMNRVEDVIAFIRFAVEKVNQIDLLG
jgi:hypothetical protein